jgi:hypothetical protein
VGGRAWAGGRPGEQPVPEGATEGGRVLTCGEQAASHVVIAEVEAQDQHRHKDKAAGARGDKALQWLRPRVERCSRHREAEEKKHCGPYCCPSACVLGEWESGPIKHEGFLKLLELLVGLLGGRNGALGAGNWVDLIPAGTATVRVPFKEPATEYVCV